HRTRLNRDHREVQRGRKQLKNRQREQLEHSRRFLVEPLRLSLERVDRTAPEVGLLRSSHGSGVSVLRRLARENGDERRRAEAAEEEPGHTADAEPAERRESEHRSDAELDLATRLLRDPGRDGVDELAVEEDDLE